MQAIGLLWNRFTYVALQAVKRDAKTDALFILAGRIHALLGGPADHGREGHR